jgi:glutaredoxin
MRTKIIAGNWKMYKTISEAIELANGLKRELFSLDSGDIDIVLCPPFTASWCGDCIWTRRFFDLKKIAYIWIDVDRDKSGEEFVLMTNHGMRSVPTILFNDGSILVEPTEAELMEKLFRPQRCFMELPWL